MQLAPIRDAQERTVSSMAALGVLSPGVPASASLIGAAYRTSSERVSAHNLPSTWEELLE